MKKYTVLLIIFLQCNSLAQTVAPYGPKILTNDLYYAPAVHNVPLFREEKELNVNANIISAFGATAAYSLTPFLSLQAGYGKTNRDDRHIHNYDAGVGYFYVLGAKNRLIIEATLSGGYGYGDIKLDGLPYYEELSYSKISIQGAFGFRDEIIECAFSPRITHFQFSNFKRPGGDTNHNWLYGDELNGTSHTLLEPVLMARVGHKNLKFGTQLGLPFSLQEGIDELNYYDRVTLVFSLSFRFGFGNRDEKRNTD